MPAAIGDVVVIGEDPGVHAEVVATTADRVRVMPYGPLTGVAAGAPARAVRPRCWCRPAAGCSAASSTPSAVRSTARARSRPTGSCRWATALPTRCAARASCEPLGLGVRVLDTLATVGRGQRLGLFAGSGVGKSSLLSMIARGTDAQVSVIALVGERGREVREFLEDDLGAEGLARSVVVVATSDEPAVMRLRAAFAATRIAEAFRDEGADVVLMMDSLTRVAMAQREIGLSAGEPPATRGYPPSTFSLLAQLLERAGTGETGSITGLYTVLVDGDDHNEPIADAARSILDGHVVLDRRLAVVGHFPSVDVLGSVSRLASRVTDAAAAGRGGGAAQHPRRPRRPPRTCSTSARTSRARTRRWTPRSPTRTRSTRSCSRGSASRADARDSWARLDALVGMLGGA